MIFSIKIRKEYWLLFFFLLYGNISIQAQYIWKNPQEQEFPVIRGRGWQHDLQGTYIRLPSKVQDKVCKAVWDLSQQSAGLSIAFYSNSPEIKIKYGVKGNRGMVHMPVTGVSGVDLYATDKNGRSRWCAAKYVFGDTITYTYRGLTYDDSSNKGYEYELFLPLYNSVSFLEIGVKEDAFFQFIPVSMEKPLVIYGTSIAQGACASRPGMAWGNIVHRELEHPVVNLGFSGNGKLEKEMFDLLAEIDAQLYLIDCLPNMVGTDTAVIAERVVEGVRILRARSDAPILLVEHSGYMNEYTSKSTEESYRAANRQLHNAYDALIKDRVARVYYLTKEEIGLSMDAMVEGVHPSDLGMQRRQLYKENKGGAEGKGRGGFDVHSL